MNTVRLGRTDISISEMGTGAWSWGDKFFWDYGQGYNAQDVQEAFEASLAAGITFIDTAEVYGWGESERLLGRALTKNKAPVVIATKFFPFPWRLRQTSVVQALRRSLDRLGLDRVDLFQVHSPSSPVAIETWMAGMADAVRAGLTRAVGVSNYDAQQTRRAHAALAQRDILLASNQVKYSLLDRRVERNGTLAACNELGITVIAYSPIEQGLLAGKYTPNQPPPGVRRRRYSRQLLERIQPLVGLLREVGQAHGKTPAQVAVNWTICKGTVPIPGAKNARQADENVGGVGWRLQDAEIAALETMSDQVSSK